MDFDFVFQTTTRQQALDIIHHLNDFGIDAVADFNGLFPFMVKTTTEGADMLSRLGIAV